MPQEVTNKGTHDNNNNNTIIDILLDEIDHITHQLCFVIIHGLFVLDYWQKPVATMSVTISTRRVFLSRRQGTVLLCTTTSSGLISSFQRHGSVDILSSDKRLENDKSSLTEREE